jgi:hypothetical protein
MLCEKKNAMITTIDRCYVNNDELECSTLDERRDGDYLLSCLLLLFLPVVVTLSGQGRYGER